MCQNCLFIYLVGFYSFLLLNSKIPCSFQLVLNLPELPFATSPQCYVHGTTCPISTFAGESPYRHVPVIFIGFLLFSHLASNIIGFVQWFFTHLILKTSRYGGGQNSSLKVVCLHTL